MVGWILRVAGWCVVHGVSGEWCRVPIGCCGLEMRIVCRGVRERGLVGWMLFSTGLGMA